MTDESTDERKLRELEALTAALPREMEPPAEAWEAIRSQMERDGELGRSGAAHRPAIWQRPAFLAAASLILVVGSSTATFVVLRGGSRAAAPVGVASSEPGTTAVSTVSSLTQFTGRENDYLRRVNGLVAIMESGDVELAPETIAKVKESLAVIDAAILEARGALARDPANRELIEMLESSYEKKLDLLQRTTEMARS